MTYTHLNLGLSIELQDLMHLNSGATVEYQLLRQNIKCRGSIGRENEGMQLHFCRVIAKTTSSATQLNWQNTYSVSQKK